MTRAGAVELALPAWGRVGRAERCPVCARPGDGAVDGEDGALVRCCHRESALPAPGGGWLHVLAADHRPPPRRDGQPGAWAPDLPLLGALALTLLAT